MKTRRRFVRARRWCALLTGTATMLVPAVASAQPPITGATLIKTIEDPGALEHAVKSKIYPEDRDTMYVTLRGGGISVFDVSNPASPTLRTRWNSDEDVEGQDRKGDLLVVVARRGLLLTFDLSQRDQIVEIGRMELDTEGSVFQGVKREMMAKFGTGPFDALHTKLYDAADGRRYALVTATATSELIAVDVTDPARPQQVGQLDTDVEFIEGIYVHRDHAFVGGFGSSELYRAIDVSNPKKMRVVHTLRNVAYRQMVSEMSPERPDLLFAALWNDEGGLGIFDVSNPERFRPVGSLVMPELRRSNRVKLLGDSAFLPLEVEPGGFAIIDASDPRTPRLVHLATNIPGISTPYTLEVHRDHLYIFGTVEPKMAVFLLDRSAVAAGTTPTGSGDTRYTLFNFESTDDTRLVEGLPADGGKGSLRFLDPESRMRERTESLEVGGFGCLELSLHSSDIDLVKSAAATAVVGVPVPVEEDHWEKGGGFILEHGIPREIFGEHPAYTLIWDLMVRDESFGTNGCSSLGLVNCNDIPLFTLDRANEDEDAILFLKVGKALSKNGFIGESTYLDGYEEGIEPDTWHRIAFVVDLRPGAASQATIYLDGRMLQENDDLDDDAVELFKAVTELDEDEDDVPVRNGFLLFADDDEDMDATVRFSSFLFVNRAYTSDEIRSLGGATADGIPPPADAAK